MTATYMDRTIDDGVTCADDARSPGQVEVTVSIGEFDGILLTVTGDGGFEMVELDFTAAHTLMLALQDALNILGAAVD